MSAGFWIYLRPTTSLSPSLHPSLSPLSSLSSYALPSLWFYGSSYFSFILFHSLRSILCCVSLCNSFSISILAFRKTHSLFPWHSPSQSRLTCSFRRSFSFFLCSLVLVFSFLFGVFLLWWIVDCSAWGVSSLVGRWMVYCSAWGVSSLVVRWIVLLGVSSLVVRWIVILGVFLLCWFSGLFCLGCSFSSGSVDGGLIIGSTYGDLDTQALVDFIWWPQQTSRSYLFI